MNCTAHYAVRQCRISASTCNYFLGGVVLLRSFPASRPGLLADLTHIHHLAGHQQLKQKLLDDATRARDFHLGWWTTVVGEGGVKRWADTRAGRRR